MCLSIGQFILLPVPDQDVAETGQRWWPLGTRAGAGAGAVQKPHQDGRHFSSAKPHSLVAFRCPHVTPQFTRPSASGRHIPKR
ncbi:hypothetical protein LMH87_003858 [Akanthomyces muscarius]|uniref:Uncharacterized protein n=1 Tax=Akanthomyces muscarius TaxID=2231603 RepID=A0A9W8Q2Y2_AKAMU|nr:hypothetical protein LMH87_003858 [Akanthomyces muscarius]KAJ4144993.1 hypothetical protein LMH87_003858 [Akanthomyces muscarius]